MQTNDNRQLYLDMQEHPERYTAPELEAMMDELDREPDVEEAWQRFEATHHTSKTSSRRWLKIAAMFVGVILMAGIALAAIHHVSTKRMAPAAVEVQPLKQEPSSPVQFDNVPLDSVLSVVAAHYRKVVLFRDEAPRHMKLIMTWQSDAPLGDFLDRLNAFDGLSLRLQGDTIFVETTTGEEDKP